MRLSRFLVFAFVLLSIPSLVLAQDVAPAAPVLGIGWPAILAILAAVGAVLAALSNAPALQGMRTYLAAGAAGIAALAEALGQLTSTGETVTTGALIAALVGVVIGRAKTGKAQP